MDTAVMNLLARRLGCTALYPDWYIVRQLLRARAMRLVAEQMQRPAMRAMVEPGRVLQGTLAGLPELRLFPDQRSRRKALDDFGASMCHDRNWRWWMIFVVMIAVSAAAGYALSAIVQYVRVAPFAYGLGNYMLRATIMVMTFLLILRKAQRVGAAAHLRILLIDRGVAVCRGCGYCLAGHNQSAARCPECGRGIDELTRGRLGAVDSCSLDSDENGVFCRATPQAGDESVELSQAA